MARLFMRLCVCLLCVTKARSQDIGTLHDERARAARAVDSLHRLVEMLPRAPASGSEALRQDTAYIDGVRALVPLSMQPTVAAAVRLTSFQLLRNYGDSSVAALGSLTIRVGQNAPRARGIVRGDYVIAVEDEAGVRAAGTFRGRLTQDVVLWFLSKTAFTRLRDTLDESLRSWWQPPPLWVGDSASERANRVRRVLGASTEVSRGCLRGKLPTCLRLFNLDGTVSDARKWYGAGDLPWLLEHDGDARDRLSRAFRDDAVTACVARRSRDACERVATRLSDVSLETPLPEAERDELLRIAIRRGGLGAWRRLALKSGEPMAARLSAASGVSIDTLVTAWRAELMQVPAQGPRPPFARVVTVIAWCTLLVCASCMRPQWA